ACGLDREGRGFRARDPRQGSFDGLPGHPGAARGRAPRADGGRQGGVRQQAEVMRAAIGLKARTGRALLVALAGDLRAPQLVERSEMPLLPPGSFAPYHAADGLPPAAARESVKRSIAAAHDLAAKGIRDAAQRIARSGGAVRGCGVLIGPGMPNW